jgi:hypothetical protein
MVALGGAISGSRPRPHGEQKGPGRIPAQKDVGRRCSLHHDTGTALLSLELPSC